MARQVGVITIHGSIGNMRNYKMTGNKFVTTALKGGPTKEQVDTLPSMEGCRNRNNEWKGCMKGTTYIRSVLSSIFPKYYDRFLTGRINAIVQQITTRGYEGEFGKRAIIFSVERPYLAGLVLNPKHKLSSVLSPATLLKVSYEHDIDRTAIQVSIPYVKAVDTFSFRDNETCVRIIQCLGSISDLSYVEVNRRYDPLDYYVPYTTQVKVSPWVAKTAVAGTELKLEDTLVPIGFAPGDDDTILQILMVEYGTGFVGSEIPTNHFGLKIIDTF